MRLSIAIFQGLGLCVGLAMIAKQMSGRFKSELVYLIMSASILMSWMFPRHKLFDVSVSIFLVAILASLIRVDTLKRHFLVGICIGVIAIVGRNHGVYSVVAYAFVFAWLSPGRQLIKEQAKKILVWGIGVLIGFSPILVAALFVPGFASEFWLSITFYVEYGATVPSLPVPWFWKNPSIDFFSIAGLRTVFFSLFFLFVFGFGLVAISWSVYKRLKGERVSPLIISAALVSIPYINVAAVRSDISHLAQAIFPALIGLIIITWGLRFRGPAIIALLGVSIFTMAPSHEGFKCRVLQDCVPIEVSSSKIFVPENISSDLRFLNQLSETYTPNGEAFVVTPFWPGAYAFLNREAPIWEVFALYPRPASFEEKEIKRIKDAEPKFLLVHNFALDGVEARRYDQTHPLTFAYIDNHYSRVEAISNSAYTVYIPKAPLGALPASE